RHPDRSPVTVPAAGSGERYLSVPLGAPHPTALLVPRIRLLGARRVVCPHSSAPVGASGAVSRRSTRRAARSHCPRTAGASVPRAIRDGTVLLPAPGSPTPRPAAGPGSRTAPRPLPPRRGPVPRSSTPPRTRERERARAAGRRRVAGCRRDGGRRWPTPVPGRDRPGCAAPRRRAGTPGGDRGIHQDSVHALLHGRHASEAVPTPASTTTGTCSRRLIVRTL